MTQKLNLEKLLKLAESWVKPDLGTVEGLKRYLMVWYCTHYNVPLKDPMLHSHTLEELLLQYYMTKIVEDPDFAEKTLAPPEEDAFEDWLKQHMGDDYVSEGQMESDMVEYSEQEQKIAEQLPDKITTDFSKIGSE